MTRRQLKRQVGRRLRNAPNNRPGEAAMTPHHKPAQSVHSSVDELVEQLVRDAAGRPQSALRAALRLPITAYAMDIKTAMTRLRTTPTPTAAKPAIPGRVWADGWRQQLPGSWPYYP